MQQNNFKKFVVTVSTYLLSYSSFLRVDKLLQGWVLDARFTQT